MGSLTERSPLGRRVRTQRRRGNGLPRREGRSKWTVRGHGECYSKLASYLRENKLPYYYSEANAWEWFEGIADRLDETRRSIWAVALCKIADLYSTGEIRSFHYRAPKKEDRLRERNRQGVEDYCRHLRGPSLAPATVDKHLTTKEPRQCKTTRFPLHGPAQRPH